MLMRSQFTIIAALDPRRASLLNICFTKEHVEEMLSMPV